MFGHDFYHETLRKYVILFGTLFNDIHVKRKDSNGNTIQKIKLPLSYAPQEKMLQRLAQDPNLNRQVAITLPRASFEMTGMQYAPDRKMNTLNRLIGINANDKSKLKYAYMPVPYDFNFQLNVYTAFAEDSTQILEQILPFFTPEWTSTLKLLPADMPLLKFDVPVVLESTAVQDTYEGDFETRRALIWTLDFRLKGLLFGPTRKTGIIKTVNNRIFIAIGDFQPANAATTDLTFTINTATTNTTFANTGAAQITTTPGLFTNNSPATVSNLVPYTATGKVHMDSTGNSISNVEVLFAGNYYTSAPTVTFAAPGNEPAWVTLVAPKFGTGAGQLTTTTTTANISTSAVSSNISDGNFDFWIKIAADSTAGRVLTVNDYMIYNNANGSLAFVYDGTFSTAVNFGSGLHDAAWHFVTMVDNGTTVRAFIDGAGTQAPSLNVTTALTLLDTSRNIVFGEADYRTGTKSKVAATGVYVDSVKLDSQIDVAEPLPTAEFTTGDVLENFNFGGATATTTLIGDEVLSINIVKAGENYNVAPAITITGPVSSTLNSITDIDADDNFGIVTDIEEFFS